MTMSPSETVRLTHALTEWLRKAGVGDDGVIADLSVDLADIIAAGHAVHHSVDELLRQDPLDPAQAGRALSLAGDLEAQLFGEMKDHLATLEVAWPALLARLDKLSPSE